MEILIVPAFVTFMAVCAVIWMKIEERQARKTRQNKNITPTIEKTPENFVVCWSFPRFGVVIATGETLEKTKKAFESALNFQIEKMVEAGEEVPSFFIR